MAMGFFGNFSLFPVEPGIVSFETLWYINVVVSVVLTTIISFLGIIFNVTNIVVFIKQGARESSNIALLALAVSDAGASLFTLLWSQQYNPLLSSYLGRVEFILIVILAAVWPHVLFTRITCWITAYITIERYLCIAIPLKVKVILNEKRIKGFIISIFLIMIISIVPIYAVSGISDVYIQEWNTTISTISSSSHSQIILRAVTSFNAVVELAAFLMTAIFTFALVQKFIAKTRWRRAKTNVSDASAMSGRDKKFIQTVILISVTFIICYIPSVLATITMVVLKELRVLIIPDFSDLAWPFAFLMESVNSTATIFIYLNMSSRYKAVFRDIFKQCLSSRFTGAENTKSEKESLQTVTMST